MLVINIIMIILYAYSLIDSSATCWFDAELEATEEVSLERRKMEAEEMKRAPAKQARSKPVTRGMLLNLSITPTCNIIINACPIFVFACAIEFMPVHVGSFLR